jgi:hypothetical protein
VSLVEPNPSIRFAASIIRVALSATSALIALPPIASGIPCATPEKGNCVSLRLRGIHLTPQAVLAQKSEAS